MGRAPRPAPWLKSRSKCVRTVAAAPRYQIKNPPQAVAAEGIFVPHKLSRSSSPQPGSANRGSRFSTPARTASICFGEPISAACSLDSASRIAAMLASAAALRRRFSARTASGLFEAISRAVARAAASGSAWAAVAMGFSARTGLIGNRSKGSILPVRQAVGERPVFAHCRRRAR